MGLLEFLAEHWLGVAAYAGGLAATGFSIWFTAKKTVATAVREKVWADVYDKKRKEGNNFYTLMAQLGGRIGV